GMPNWGARETLWQAPTAGWARRCGTPRSGGRSTRPLWRAPASHRRSSGVRELSSRAKREISWLVHEMPRLASSPRNDKQTSGGTQMTKFTTDTILPTTMVGSYPRQTWFTQQLDGRDIR